MRTQFHQWGEQNWHTPGEIVEDLQQQHYRVYAIEYDDQWYAVDAYDPQGTRVELKVNPKTRKVITWIIRSANLNNQKPEEQIRLEERVAAHV